MLRRVHHQRKPIGHADLPEERGQTGAYRCFACHEMTRDVGVSPAFSNERD
jgi:hypothetical protein